MKFDQCGWTHSPSDPGFVATLFGVALLVAFVAPVLQSHRRSWVRTCARWSARLVAVLLVTASYGISKDGVWVSPPPCGIEVVEPPTYPIETVRLLAFVVTVGFFLLLFRGKAINWYSRLVGHVPS